MGFTIARQLVNTHGGRLNLIIDRRWKGTNFQLILPRKRSRATIYKGSVVVRAESEQQAPELVCSDFSDAGLPMVTTTDRRGASPTGIRCHGCNRAAQPG